MTLEKPDFPFVFYGRCAGRKCSQIPPFACLRVFFARVEAVLARGEFSDHTSLNSKFFIIIEVNSRIV